MPQHDTYVKRLTYRAQDRVALLRSLSLGEQSTVMQSLSPYVQQQILQALTTDEVVDILDHMDLRIAQQVVMRITDTKRREKVIQKLKADMKDKLEYFLRFHPKATMSLVHFNYVLIAATTTVAEVSTIVERHYEETGKFPEILVHEAGVLVGEVSIGVLVRERNSAVIEKFVQPVTTISYQAEVGQIVDTLATTDVRKVIVLDHDGSVLGVIYAEDAIELFGGLPTETLYSLAGVDSSERPFDSAYRKFRNRSPWLTLNLLTTFMAAGVILFFQDTMNALTFLSIYIPIIAGMGGNAASQTFAVTMRAITLGSISWSNGWTAVKREVAGAFMSGLWIGGVVTALSLMFGQSIWLGLVVAASMLGVHVIAGFVGIVVPLTIKKFGFDPAMMSMVFISTATDVLGLLLLLGLGTLLLL